MNPQNNIIKHKYLRYLEHVKGLLPITISKYEKPIHYYEIFFNDEDYGKYNMEKAIMYKEMLLEEELGPSTIRAYLNHIKVFFSWLQQQPGFRSKISLNDVEYLNTTKKDKRLASQIVIKEFPSKEYVMKLAESVDKNTDIGFRNKALISFLYCTGMRDSAVMTLPLGCVDVDQMMVTQDPRLGVDVKFSKIIYSKIFQFENTLIENILGWIMRLNILGFSSNNPLFPKSKEAMSDKGYSFENATEVSQEYWKSTVSLREVVKEAAIRAKVKYYPPHSYRHAAIVRALKASKNAMEIKAVSQNFGHEEVATTMSYYGNLPPNELMEVVGKINFDNFSQNPSSADLKRTLEEAIKMIP